MIFDRTLVSERSYQLFRGAWRFCGRNCQKLLNGTLWATGLLIVSEATALSFSGPEVLKLDWSTRSLNVSDIDNDGLNDLAVINNDTAKIELFYQIPEGVDASGQKRQLNRNRWEPVLEDARFQREAVPIGFPLFDLTIGDLNGDGKDDLAYTGRESPLTVRFQGDSGNWTETEEFDGFEALGWTDTLEIADIDADGNAELIVISADGLRILASGTDGHLHEEAVYYITGKNPFNLKIEDVTRDGRLDIVYITADGKQSLVLREQLEEGEFGPELRFSLDRPVRAIYTLPQIGDESASFCSVDSRSGSLEFFDLEKKQIPKDQENLSLAQPEVYPIFKKGRSAASYALGDLNGDGQQDLLIANPDKAEVVLFLKESGYFHSPQTFPSFAEISSMSYGRFFTDDQNAVVIVSAGERMMGISRMSPEGRIEFPRRLVVGEGDPLVCQVINPDGNEYDELALVSKIDGVMTLIVAQPSDRGDTDAEWVELSRIPLEGVKRKPYAIREVPLLEGNRRGLMVFVPREVPVFLSVSDSESMKLEEFAQESTVRESLLKGVQPAQISILDINMDGKNELIVGQTGYARALQVKGETLEMVDQFNALRSEDEVSAIIPFYDEGKLQQLVFYVEAAGEFQIIKRSADSVFRYDTSIDTGNIKLIDWYWPSKLQDTGELIFAGTDRFWDLNTSAGVWSRVVKNSYETDLEDVFYNFVEVADFDQDGAFELIAVDGQNHVVEMLTQAEEGFESRMYWEIFEQNLHYQGRNGSKTEPRQVVVADLTNDGKLDFAFLIHDRILFYPQQ